MSYIVDKFVSLLISPPLHSCFISLINHVLLRAHTSRTTSTGFRSTGDKLSGDWRLEVDSKVFLYLYKLRKTPLPRPKGKAQNISQSLIWWCSVVGKEGCPEPYFLPQQLVTLTSFFGLLLVGTALEVQTILPTGWGQHDLDYFRFRFAACLLKLSCSSSIYTVFDGD